MSELTKCNWHTLQHLIEKYGSQNIKLEADENWIAVMVFKPDPPRPITEIDYSRPGEGWNEDWEHVASFLALTMVCVC